VQARLQTTTIGLTFYGVNFESLSLALVFVLCFVSGFRAGTSYTSHGSPGIYDHADAQALTGWLGAGEGRGEEFLAAA
jgi:hypothetical protein